MSAMTHAELRWLAEEFPTLLQDAAIQKVHAGPARQRILQARRPGKTSLFLIDTAPESSRAHAIAKRPAGAGTHPGPFTMLMRKWIQGMVVRQVDVDPYDRILTLRGDRLPPDWEPDQGARPDRVPVTMVVEWLGANTNTFVLGHEDRILGMEASDALPGRTLKVGDRWRAPGAAPPPGERNRFAGQDVAPPEALAATPRNAAAAAWYERTLPRAHIDQERAALAARLRRERKRARRRARHVEGDLDRALASAQWRQWGELLQSGYGRIPRGAKSARVPNYYEEGMPEVEIPLDPARSLQENIDHYFKHYRRLHGAKARIEARLMETLEQMEALDEALEHLEREAWDGVGALQAWAMQLERARLLPRGRPQSARARQAPKKPYRTFTSRGGKAIVVGRHARGNDEVSTHVARGRDIWMHAKDWAGSHVLLRMERGEEPTHEDLLDAATLAAHFSKGSRDTVIDVTYTQAKHVRKPKGYPTGRVTVAGGATLAVSRDEARLERLLGSEQS